MSKLTQKDFEKIADIIFDSPTTEEVKKKLAENFSGYLSTTNPLFCKKRFTERVLGEDIPWAEANLLE